VASRKTQATISEKSVRFLVFYTTLRIMFSRSLFIVGIAGALVLTTAMSSDARPRRRIAQNCTVATRNCKPPVKRLVPCLDNPSQLCVVMRGDTVASQSGSSGNQIQWNPIAGATHYQVAIEGYNWAWRSGAITADHLDYSQIPLKDGHAYHAYLVKVTAYGPTGEIGSIEQAINIPAQVTASSR
jgi:hypothetical protein